MAVFKRAKCISCNHIRNESKPKKTPDKCPKCADRMLYSDNWYISYQLFGKKYVQAVAPQKREAEVKLGKIKVDIREGRHFDVVPSTPWNKAVEQFRQWFEVNVKPHTQRMYENGLKNISPHFDRLTLDKITPPMVEQYKAMRSTEVKPATVNRDLSTLKRLFSLSEEWGLVETNRIRKVKLLRENNARLRFLIEDEIERLLKACKDNTEEYDLHKKKWKKIAKAEKKANGKATNGNHLLWLAVQIALETGLRKEGVLTLKWSEIDFQRGLVGKQVKGDKTVHIPLTRRLTEILKTHKNESKVLSAYVLTSPRNHDRPIVDLKKGFHAALGRAKITDFRFHDLRHTFATHFLRNTKDFRALQEILGHSDYRMTLRYSHVLDDHKREAMEAFERGVSRG